MILVILKFTLVKFVSFLLKPLETKTGLLVIQEHALVVIMFCFMFSVALELTSVKFTSIGFFLRLNLTLKDFLHIFVFFEDQDTLPVIFVIKEVSSVSVAMLISELTMAMLRIILDETLVDAAILPANGPLPFHLAVNELSFIYFASLGVLEFTFAVSHAV